MRYSCRSVFESFNVEIIRLVGYRCIDRQTGRSEFAAEWHEFIREAAV